MKKAIIAVLALVLFSSHDMFLKLDSYFLEPGQKATIKLYNGTFDRSENVIDRSRMTDVSVVGAGKRNRIDTTYWTEKDSMTLLSITTGSPGTWVAGVSTKPRNIELSATDFNNYLDHDGVVDMLEWRRENDALGKDAVEKYSKHVKTIFQVGQALSDDYKSTLGYPIEFVPLDNPYDLHAGHAMRVQLLWQGQPLENQLVYVAGGSEGHGNDHSHEHEDGEVHVHDANTDSDDTSDATESNHHHHDATSLRTDVHGIVSVNITGEGEWYLRTIHLVHSEEEGLTHESNWATLTFAIGTGHTHGEDTHLEEEEHSHNEEEEFPTNIFWIGSVLILLILFFWFNRKKVNEE